MKTQTLIWQISQMGYFFALILENFTPAQKYFTQVPLVTKSTSVKLGKGSKEWKKHI